MAKFEVTSNYIRGLVKHDPDSFKNGFSELLHEPSFAVSDGFLFLFRREEDEIGLLTDDLIYLGTDEREIHILDGFKHLARIPYERVSQVSMKSITKHPMEFFLPPAIPPRSGMLLALDFVSEAGCKRSLVILFPDLALMAFEADDPSQAVLANLMTADKTHHFLSEPSDSLNQIHDKLNPQFIPKDTDQEACDVLEYFG